MIQFEEKTWLRRVVKKPPTRRCLATNSVFCQKNLPERLHQIWGPRMVGIPTQNLNKKTKIWKKKGVYHVISWYVIVTSYALWNIRVDFLLVATKYTQDRRSGLLLRHRWNCVDFHVLKLGTLKSSFSSGEIMDEIVECVCMEFVTPDVSKLWNIKVMQEKKREFVEWHHSRIAMAFFGGNTERSAIVFQTLSLRELSRSIPWS